MAGEGFGDAGGGESVGEDAGGQCLPPRGRRFPLVNTQSAEHAGIAEDEGAFFLEEDQMIVFRWSMGGIGDDHFPGHAEVPADPDASGEGKKHVLPMRE